jgi:hypothetical protein
MTTSAVNGSRTRDIAELQSRIKELAKKKNA